MQFPLPLTYYQARILLGVLVGIDFGAGLTLFIFKATGSKSSTSEVPPFAYARTFDSSSMSPGPRAAAQVAPVAAHRPETISMFPGGHRQFLPVKSSEELQREFKQKEEEAPVRRASRWGQSTPDLRDAILYGGSLAVAIFTLLLISGRLPFL